MHILYSYYICDIYFTVLCMSHFHQESVHSLKSSYLLEHSLLLLQMVASDGVQQSVPVTVNILVIDANDNTPTFSQVSYNIEVFTNMQAGETVIQVSSSFKYKLPNYAPKMLYYVDHKALNH